MRELTILLRHALGKTLLRAFSQLDFVGRGKPTASAFACTFGFFLRVASLLPFFLGTLREGSSPEFVGEFGQFCPSFPPREEGVVSTEQRRDLRFELFP